MGPIRLASWAGGAGALVGAATAGYAHWEARQYCLRELTVPVLPPGTAALRVLHLSDIHLVPSQRAKRDWLASLAGLSPDLVVNTGDNLAHAESVPWLLDSLGPLLSVPGVFVLGSNDYFEPVLKNPLRYLGPDSGWRNTSSPELPWRHLAQSFVDSGWTDLTNSRATVEVAGRRLAFAGVDDPHLEYDDLASVAGRADPTAEVRLAIAHAPYLRVLNQFAADGYDAILAGHTHGGQVCMPWFGGAKALATNCDLDRERAKGLHRHPADSRPGQPGSAWLHVSAGLGTSPYTRVRIACRPEATLLTLIATA
ncbi:metallophosphoesterase [soil metagenome]